MDLQWHDSDSDARFSAYVEDLSACLGHADRVAPFRSYCTGLLLPGGRKSVEPMAARLRPDRTSAEHQSLLHFVGQSPWHHEALLGAVRASVLPVITADHPIEAWIVDDTGMPKKGKYPGLGTAIRQTMSIAIDGVILPDALLEAVTEDSEIFVLPKIGGG